MSPTDKKELNKKDIDVLIKIWEKSIDTQIHFNDLLVKMRTTVVSVVLAVFGAALFSLKDLGLFIEIKSFKLHFGAIIIAFGIAFLIAQYYIDRFYYMKLLSGSVKFTEDIDNEFKGLKIFGLTNAILEKVPHGTASNVILIFYSIPIIMGVIGIIIILFLPLK